MTKFETVLFFRDGYFYPVTIAYKKGLNAAIQEHVELNPGTTKVTSISGKKVYWSLQ